MQCIYLTLKESERAKIYVKVFKNALNKIKVLQHTHTYTHTVSAHMLAHLSYQSKYNYGNKM